ncbi:MAG: enoyl-CoA hydratase/isomerase family protein [Candidatus Eremiobacteraeota bacterium]|nr:enoyl-CoA hydratase/isomerase family protein [Candidatus Eremiobacteraeota bacterium]MBV8356280.1 enoyl-CoA hydratase/isomerase family protein [Candidatus Eremiobacteraeota bacterium]
MAGKITTRKDGAIGWLIFDNPERRNAVSLEMWEAIPVVLDDFEGDPGIRVIVLTGAGEKAFVSGADISQFEERRSSPELIEAYDRVSGTGRQRLRDATKPTLAMIRGYCIGGGLSTALACDLRVASDDARFGIPAAKLGIGYRYGAVRELVNVIGPAYAREVLFTGRQFSAEEALRMGLVNRVTAGVRLEEEVRGYCDAMAANAPLSIRAAAFVIRELGKDESERDRAACDAAVAACFTSADYVEGRTAFMEKRRPVFMGS